jgi:hypothetical protein
MCIILTGPQIIFNIGKLTSIIYEPITIVHIIKYTDTHWIKVIPKIVPSFVAIMLTLDYFNCLNLSILCTLFNKKICL